MHDVNELDNDKHTRGGRAIIAESRAKAPAARANAP